MSNKRWALLVAVAAVGSFLGAGAGQVLLPAAAEASKAPQAQKRVVAQEFVMVDAQGRTQVRIAMNEEGLATVYWLAKGQESAFVLGNVAMPKVAPAPAAKPAAPAPVTPAPAAPRTNK